MKEQSTFKIRNHIFFWLLFLNKIKEPDKNRISAPKMWGKKNKHLKYVIYQDAGSVQNSKQVLSVRILNRSHPAHFQLTAYLLQNIPAKRWLNMDPLAPCASLLLVAAANDVQTVLASH